jgi:hypothetical protein
MTDARAPAMIPAIPSIAPMGIETAAMAKFPHHDLVLLLKSTFLTKPVAESPMAMKSTGTMPIQKFPPETSHPSAMITPYIMQNETSYMLSST